jgi:hypothetical protein
MNIVASRYNASIKPAGAITQILSCSGDHLILAYGYISSGGGIPAIFDQLMTWLAGDKSRHLSVFVGVIYDSRKPDSQAEKEKEIRETFKKLLPESIYRSGVSERIDVHAVKNFHPKVCLLQNWGKKAVPFPVAAFIGSSNLSASALWGEDRFELDIFMTGGKTNLLLVDLARWLNATICNALDKEIPKIGQEIEDRIFYRPAIQEAERELKEEEFEIRKKWKHEPPDMAEALYESDRALGIRADDSTER